MSDRPPRGLRLLFAWWALFWLSIGVTFLATPPTLTRVLAVHSSLNWDAWGAAAIVGSAGFVADHVTALVGWHTRFNRVSVIGGIVWATARAIITLGSSVAVPGPAAPMVAAALLWTAVMVAHVLSLRWLDAAAAVADLARHRQVRGG